MMNSPANGQGKISKMWKEIRKFGWDYCDLPTMLWNVAVGLRVLLLNIESHYKKGIPWYYYVLTLVTAVCYFYVFLFDMLWFVFYRCRHTGDMIAAMIVLSLGVSSEIGTVKLFYMYVKADLIRKMSDQYLDCDAQKQLGSRFQDNLHKALKAVKKRAFIYWSVVYGNGVLYLLAPVVTPGRNLPENSYVIYGLEPMFESPNFEIAFFMMSAGVWFICYVPACVTTFLIVLSGYTEAQLLALSEELIQIWPDAVKNVKSVEITEMNQFDANNKLLINEHVEKRLKEIIRRHALLINLFLKLEDVFRGVIATGLLLLVLGLLTELLGKLENTFLQLPFSIMQVAMDCFTGQRLVDASIIFEQAVYDCQWENFSKSNMKMVLVMLQSSQKNMTLSAGGIAMLNFTCLMAITRGIYSAYAALRSTI